MRALYSFIASKDQVFKLGRIEIAKELYSSFGNNELKMKELLKRHAACDWGHPPFEYRSLLSNNNKKLVSIFPYNDHFILIETAWDCSQTKVKLLK